MATIATKPNTRAMPNDFRANSSCRRFSRYQAEMLRTKKAPRTQAPSTTCVRRCKVLGLKTTAQKSVISARGPASVWTIWYPAAVCIQELATTINTAENVEPTATMHVEKKCIIGKNRVKNKKTMDKKLDT